MKELMEHEGFHRRPLGIVLMSTNTKCNVCGGNLLVRMERPSFPVVYTNDFFCWWYTLLQILPKQLERLHVHTALYKFHSEGNESEVIYDDEYSELPYFVSSHMTAFETKLLYQLTAEILLGHISYQQRSDIYNYVHGYDSARKQCNQPTAHARLQKSDRYMFVHVHAHCTYMYMYSSYWFISLLVTTYIYVQCTYTCAHESYLPFVR